jgi:hypothetical protein
MIAKLILIANTETMYDIHAHIYFQITLCFPKSNIIALKIKIFPNNIMFSMKIKKHAFHRNNIPTLKIKIFQHNIMCSEKAISLP